MPMTGHPAGAEAAANDQAFGIAPILELQEAAYDCGELLGEFLDSALHNAGGFRVTINQERGQLFSYCLLAGLLAEGGVGRGPSAAFATCRVAEKECHERPGPGTLSNERPTKTLELTPRQIDEITELFAILELFVALQASQHFLFEGPHCAAHHCTGRIKRRFCSRTRYKSVDQTRLRGSAPHPMRLNS